MPAVQAAALAVRRARGAGTGQEERTDWSAAGTFSSGLRAEVGACHLQWHFPSRAERGLCTPPCVLHQPRQSGAAATAPDMLP